ncbi:hypothetical protein Tco_1144971 [Tanacetum coccineum]
MVPRTVLTRSGLILLNTARPVNTVQPRTTVNNAGPMKNVINNAYSTARRPFNKLTTANNNNFTKKVNTVRPKAVLSAVKGNKGNVVKASACWVWRPKHKGNPQQDLKNKGVIDSGCSSHDRKHILFLSEQIMTKYDAGFVAFMSLTLLQVVSQMCDKKDDGNSFTDTECVVLSLDFKLTDESHVLLKVPRKDNMYKMRGLKDCCSQESLDAGFKPSKEEEKTNTEDLGNENEASGKDSEVPSIEDPREDQRVNQELDASINSTNNINTASDGNSTNNVNAVSLTVNAAVIEVNAVDPKTSIELPNDPNMPELEDIVYSDDDEDVGAKADMNNLDAFMPVSPIPTTRIHKDHPVDQIIGDLNSAPQTRRMTKNLKEHGLFSSAQQRTNHKDFQNCLFACFLSQEEPKKVIQALKDPSWIEAMQDELLQFKLQRVWTLVDLPNRKRAIGTKWVYRNKKDERGIMIKKQSKIGYSKTQADVAKMISDVIQQECENLRSEITSQINDAISNKIPSQDDLPIWLALKYKFKRLHVATTPCRPSSVRPIDQDDPHDDAHPEEENREKRQKTNQEQLDDFGFWTDSYATDDYEIPYEKVLRELMDEMSHSVDEAKLLKVVDEMLRQRCTSGDEHKYHIDQMQNFLKNDIVWESRKEIIVTPHPQRSTLKGSSRPEKIVMFLHKFPAVIFPDDDIKERTSRWIVQIIKTYWELGHEHKFITEIVARRENGSIVSITKSDYKNLNKNDIEDIYLLIVNHNVDDYAETGLLWSLSVFIRSTVI